ITGSAVRLEGRTQEHRLKPMLQKADFRHETFWSLGRNYFLGDFRRATSKSMYCWRAWGSAPRRRRPLTKRVGVLRTSRSFPLARLASTSAAAWGLLRQDLKMSALRPERVAKSTIFSYALDAEMMS